MKQAATLPGKIVAMMVSDDHDLFVVYEQPRAWWQFWRGEYGVRRFEAEELSA